VRISGAISMACWILVIIFGRFIAYDWYKCAKLQPNSILYAFAECANLYTAGENEESVDDEEMLNDDVDPLANGGTMTPGALPALPEETPAAPEAAPTDESPPDPNAVPPAQPTPGQGG
jgi:hypothetical protein